MQKTEMPEKRSKKNHFDILPSNDPPLYFEMDNPFMDFVKKNGSKIAWGLLGLFVLFALLYRWNLSQEEGALMDYRAAELYFKEFASSDEMNLEENEAYLKLKAILTKHRELKPKYDGLIAQILLSRKHTQDAIPYFEEVVERVQFEKLSPYIDYSKSTFLIAAGKYQEAAQKSQALSDEMNRSMKDAISKSGWIDESTLSFGPSLLGFNALRLAFLDKKVNSNSSGSKAWENFQTQMKNADGNYSQQFFKEKSYGVLFSHFSEGSMNLNDYIESQKNHLK